MASVKGFQPVLHKKKEAGHCCPASWFWIADLVRDLDGQPQIGGCTGEPFLDIQGADDGRLALTLGFREFHGVLCVFLLR